MRIISEPEQILKNFLVPDNTRIEANKITVEGDVIVGNHSNIEYGIIGDTIILGEGVTVSGDIAASSDIRIDMWSKLGRYRRLTVSARSWWEENRPAAPMLLNEVRVAAHRAIPDRHRPRQPPEIRPSARSTGFAELSP